LCDAETQTPNSLNIELMSIDKVDPAASSSRREARGSADLPRVHDGSWLPAPERLSFPTGAIDVWLIRLDDPPSPDEPTLLSPDELSRANRLHFEKDRARFSRCRSSLRRMISRYLEVPPNSIQLDYLPSGKPIVSHEQNPRHIQFNVSHSSGVALIAFTAAHEVGVDLEAIRTDLDTAVLAKRFFSPREREELESLPVDLRVTGFYACWTRKEAFLKATGAGLSFPLSGFSVTTHPDLPARLLEIAGELEPRKEWTLFDLKPPEGFRASVATEKTEFQLRTLVWG
jgi:4'-phosphopantetheinyl transferase